MDGAGQAHSKEYEEMRTIAGGGLAGYSIVHTCRAIGLYIYGVLHPGHLIIHIWCAAERLPTPFNCKCYSVFGMLGSSLQSNGPVGRDINPCVASVS